MVSRSGMTLDKLKKLAKKMGLKNYSTLKKSSLMAKIRRAAGGKSKRRSPGRKSRKSKRRSRRSKRSYKKRSTKRKSRKSKRRSTRRKASRRKSRKGCSFWKKQGSCNRVKKCGWANGKCSKKGLVGPVYVAPAAYVPAAVGPFQGIPSGSPKKASPAKGIVFQGISSGSPKKASPKKASPAKQLVSSNTGLILPLKAGDLCGYALQGDCEADSGCFWLNNRCSKKGNPYLV